MIDCPICNKHVKENNINAHIDSGCHSFIEGPADVTSNGPELKPSAFASLVKTGTKRAATALDNADKSASLSGGGGVSLNGSSISLRSPATGPMSRIHPSTSPSAPQDPSFLPTQDEDGPGTAEPPPKRIKASTHLQRAAPLAERMRPCTLDEVYGQDLVGQNGVLRGLVETDRVPSMIMWGGAGTGKTTIARLIAHLVGSRFVEINSTSSGVAECKKIFAEARSELGLTGRKTIL